MTIALRAAGTPTGATAATTAVNPSTPSDCQAGDLAVLTVSMKPYSTTITTPSGWTKVGEATNGTVATGTDVGSTKVAVFVQMNPKGSTAVGNLSFTGANSCAAVINVYSKADSATWNIDTPTYTSGGDSTNGTNYSATGSAGLSVASGDWVIASSAINSDLGTISAEAIGGMSGATIGTTVERTNRDVTTGNDSNLLVVDAPITAGSSSAAPTLTYTNASSTSGTTLFLRLREESARTVLNTTNLTDAFSSISGSWTATHATAVSNQAKLAAGAGYDFAALVHTSRWDFTAGDLILEVPTFTATAPGGADQRLFILRLFDGALASTSPYNYFDIRMESNAAAVATIRGVSGTAGTGTDYGQVTYNSSTHRWIRMAESSGVIHYYFSADGYNWSEFGSGFTPAWGIKDMVLRIEATGSIAHDVFIDNLNLPTTPAITQAAYRWYADGTESGSTALAAQDTSYTANAGTSDVNLLLRVLLQSTNSTTISSTDDFRLQYEKNASGTWVDVQAASAESLMDTYASTNVDTDFTFQSIGGGSEFSQSFLGDGKYLTKASFWLKKLNSGQNVSAAVYAHSGTYGTSSLPTGTALGTTGTVNASSISTTYAWYDFTFSTPVQLTNGTAYCIAAVSTMDDTNRLAAGGDTSSSTHGGNPARKTGGWSTISGDLAFRVYTAVLVSNVYVFNSSNLTDGNATTNRLTGGTGSFSAGKISEDGLADDVGWAGNDFTELLYAITLESDDLVDTDTLKFRVLHNGAATYMTYSSYPQITIGAGVIDHDATGTSTITQTATATATVEHPATATSTITATGTATANITRVAASSITDDFASLANWTTDKTTIVSGTAQMDSLIGYDSATMRHNTRVNLVGSSWTFKLPTNVAAVTGSDENWITLRLANGTSGTNPTGRDWVGWWIYNDVGGRDVVTQYRSSNTNTDLTLETYSATDHLWLRITESAGSVSWYRSADGASWTQIGSSWTSTIDLTDVEVWYEVSGSVASTAQVDKVNLVTQDHSAAGTSTITATGTATGTADHPASASSTITQSPTSTATVSKSVTGTSTITQTPTATAASSRSATGSSTITQSPTATATADHPATATSTITATGTSTAASSRSASASSTITQSPTSTATVDKSVTGSSTITQTAAATATISKSVTGSSTITQSPTASADVVKATTGSSTITSTQSASATADKSITASSTITQSPSATTTAAFAATGTSTITATGTASVTVSKSVTGSSTITQSPTAAATVDKSVTGSSTITQSPTASATAAFAASGTSTITNTPTATASAARSATASSTITNSQTAAGTADHPATATSTITATGTATATVSKSIAGTSTITNTPAASATNSTTASGSSTILATVVAAHDGAQVAAGSSTITSTQSASATADKPVTASSTITNSPSATANLTTTAAASSTVTSTQTAAVTVSKSVTATSTITNTPTATAANSTTASGSSTITANTTAAADTSGAETADASSTITATTAADATASHPAAAASTITATTSATADVVAGSEDHEADGSSLIVATAEAILQAAYEAAAASTITASATATLTVPVPPTEKGWEDTVYLGPGEGTVRTGTQPGRVLVGAGSGSVHAGTPSTLTVRVGS